LKIAGALASIARFFKEREMRHPSKPAFLNGQKYRKEVILEKRAETNQEKRDVKGENQGRLRQGEREEKKASSQV
jgi:hypothetical protein